MSLLLKALEKSEENQEAEAAGTQKQEGTAAGSGTGGMKLSGGGQSKLGNALAGARKGTSAKKVVAAYQEDEAGLGGEDIDEAQEALAKASRNALVRNIVVLVVLAAVAYGGWQAYSQFFPATQQVAEESAASSTDAAPPIEEVVVAVDDTAFLPLAEPIYDIQENILTASASPSTSESGSEQRDVIRDVQSYVERILEDQLRRSEAAARATDTGAEEVDDLTSSENRELTELLAEEINWEEIEPVNSNAEMLAKLEALSQVPESRDDAKQFIRKSGGNAVVASSSEQAGNNSSEGEASVQRAEPPRAVAQITKKSNELGNVMEKAVAQYRSGNLSDAEISFRTILAAEPRNANALVGLAKVHNARGKNRLAVATLLKASEYSPNNPVIITELVAIQSSAGSSVLSESTIIELLGRTGDKAVQSKLLFILGNIYAESQNWSQAKSTFYEAHQINQENPDIAYNLAVVYDFLGDTKRALGMYSTALSAALEQPSNFNHQVARDRIETLNNN